MKLGLVSFVVGMCLIFLFFFITEVLFAIKKEKLSKFNNSDENKWILFFLKKDKQFSVSGSIVALNTLLVFVYLIITGS